jgi:pantetheine-phosphate adenylyltransferase
MSKLAVYPGSFDPFTLGHLDVAKRALGLFDRLQILVVHNPAKAPNFSAAERKSLIEAALVEAGITERVEVGVLESGLLAHHCEKVGATVIVKGVRNDSDLQTELPQARVNRDQTGIETVFVPGDPALSHISSSLVRQVASLGGDIKLYVPKSVFDAYWRL